MSNKENQNTPTKQLVKLSRQRLASEDQLFLTSPFREDVVNDSQEIVNLFTRTSITDETIANYSKLKNNLFMQYTKFNFMTPQKAILTPHSFDGRTTGNQSVI